MIVMGMHHFDKSRRSKMVNNDDETKDMASKGCRKAMASPEDDFKKMGADPQFYVAGDQQGLERSVSQAEDCSCCKSHRRDLVLLQNL